MTAARGAFWDQRRARHPRLRHALVEDARVACRYRGEPHEFGSRLEAAGAVARLAWVSDAFLGLALYRLKARLQALGVPVLPRVAHRLAMVASQVCIGDPVVVEPGVYVPHGQVVLDGVVEIAGGVVLFPFVTIGLRAGHLKGATVEREVTIGTGAKVIGELRIGAGAHIGANAVVLNDVAPATTVVGAPARLVP